MFVLRPFLLTLPLACLASSAALAQNKTSSMLNEKLPLSVSKQAPTFVLGDTVNGQSGGDLVIEGHAEMRKPDNVIRADKITFNQNTDMAYAHGDVRINRQGNRYWGPDLELNVNTFQGFFSQPSYEFLKNKGKGSADRVDFVSERLAVAKNATFSTCARPEGADGKAWQPDWLLRAESVTFDVDEDIATATGAHLRFKDVPVLAFPPFSFPMSDKRKSGFLSPTLASDNQSGFEYTQPYYWNMAPNRDMTLYPSWIANRGLNMGGEFRYLEPGYSGLLRADYLPNDKLYGGQRWAYSLDNRNVLTPSSSLRLQLNRVSDDSYWRDFPRASSALTQRLLNNEAQINASHDGWATLARLQRWQTLQDAGNPIAPPFDRSQVNTRKNFYLSSGILAQVEADVTAFTRRETALTDTVNQPSGKRVYSALQLSKSWQSPSGYITPKVLLHARAYQLDTATSADSFQQRVIPTLSVDSGLTFERDTQLFGRAFSQTLEPRAFYVRSPYRNQTGLPNYDSGGKDFTMATIYSENPYVGNDRIADMNMLTLGVTSRFLNPTTGQEALRMGLAQRYRLSDQRVTLPGEAAQTDRLSDWLLNAAVNMNSTWAVDATTQFGAKSHVTERTTLTTRFNPGSYRSLYAAYRMQKDVSEQVDVGWQWPVGDLIKDSQWYTVGRLNYSTRDQRLVNAIVGFEYDADCWVGRIALEQTQLDLNTTNQRLMFQIEFVGFARAGISPLASLRRNIPRYQNLREQTTSPSRFSQYD